MITILHNKFDITPKRKSVILLIILIVGTGFLFRFLGIFWGMPLFNKYERNYHPDETKIINGAANFPQHIMTNKDLRYPTFCHYFIGILALPLRGLLKLLNIPSYEYIHLLARLVSVFIGTITIYLTYRYTVKVYDIKRGILASFFLAFSMFHVQDSAWATTDVMTAFFGILFLILLSDYNIEKGCKYFVYSGIVFGLAVGTKYTAALLLIPLVIKHTNSVISRLPSERLFFYFFKNLSNYRIFIFLITSLIIFLITTPGIFFHFYDFLKSINYERTRLFTHSLSYSNPILWLNIMNDFIRAVGYPLAILFFCGLLYPFKKKIEWTVMVGVICGLIFYFGNSLVSRYLIFVMPMIAVISSHCAFSLIESKMKFVSIISSCVVIFISIYSISYSAAAVYSRFDDTRTRAARFVDEKIHPDSSIGIALTSFRFGGKLPHSWKYPKIDFNKFRFVNFLEKPEYLILSSFDYEKILRALKSNKISSYYVWKEEYNKEWYRSTPPTPEIFKFYDDLFFKNKGEYELIISFQKRQLKAIAVPAPEILIYKKR